MSYTEALAILVDNSPYSRNSEMSPNLLETQKELIGTICNNCIEKSAESSSVIISYGSRPKQLCSNSRSMYIIYQLLRNLQPERQIGFTQVDIVSAIQIAILALRKRENKNAEPKIILFSCSSLEHELNSLDRIKKWAKMLRKEDISIDIYNFGRYASINEVVLKEIVQYSNKKKDGIDTSNYYCIPQGFSSLRNGIEYITKGSNLAGKQIDLINQDMNEENDPALREAMRLSMQDYAQKNTNSNHKDDENKDGENTEPSEPTGFNFKE